MKEKIAKRKTTQAYTVKAVTRSALFTAIICVLAVIAIPAGPIPFTLGLLAVLLAAVVLNPVESVFAVTAYVLLGVVGLPVFSSGASGIGTILGPTGGYIYSYPITAIMISLSIKFTEKRIRNTVLLTFLTFLYCLAGVTVLYIIGTLHFSLTRNTSYISSLSVCVFPFIPFDILKCALAAIIGIRVRKLVYKKHN
ncbi:MAG: biotin transporter BioY [Christensenellaceae bacterium]